MESNTVREYYDDFLRSRMVNYRLYGNLRLDRAAERILPFVGTDSKVLDIGCGIGIVTSKVAARASRGHVWGIDMTAQRIGLDPLVPAYLKLGVGKDARG
jgi:trans-aconitate 2-methyltransferase